MKRKSKGESAGEKQYQFDSAFPMDETMQRLHDQMGPIHGELLFLKKYKIWSDKRRDRIQFEIVKRPSRARHKLTITGTIRDIHENRSVLECQVQGNNPKRHTALWALPLFLTILLMATYRGPFQLTDALLPSLIGTGIVLYVLAPRRFPELGADDFAHIRNALGYRESPDQMTGKNKAKPMPN